MDRAEPGRAPREPGRPRWLAVALAAATLAAAGCVPDVPPEAADATGSTPGAPPALAENRLDPLPGTPEPDLPVTVDSIVPGSVTDADDEPEYEDIEVDDASRILPLTGMLAEVVFTLGFGDNVVGRDAAATFEEAADLPAVSEGHDVSAESVLSLEPTVILADTWTGPPETIEQLRGTGIPVVIVEEAWSVTDVYPRIERVAEALGVPDRGTELAERTREQLDEVTASAPQGEPLSVAFLYLRGTAGVYLIGGRGSGADELLETVGAVDSGVAMGLEEPFTPITSEALIEAQPDVILVMTGGLESVGGVDGLVEIPGVAQTPAGQNRRVVDFEDGLLLSFGPRTPQVVAALAEELYGEESDA